MKILSVIFLITISLSACSSITELNSLELNNGLVEIERSVEEIEVAITELETDLAELLADELVMSRLENMSMVLDGQGYISMNDISLDSDLGSILSRSNALKTRAFEILAIEIPAYVEAHPDSYHESCGDPELSTPECLPGQLQIHLEYLMHERLGNLFPFNMAAG